MPNFDRPSRYHIYLLTIWAAWRRDPKAPSHWRFSLENSRTGQRRGFADLTALVAALEQIMRDDEEERGDG